MKLLILTALILALFACLEGRTPEASELDDDPLPMLVHYSEPSEKYVDRDSAEILIEMWDYDVDRRVDSLLD